MHEAFINVNNFMINATKRPKFTHLKSSGIQRSSSNITDMALLTIALKHTIISFTFLLFFATYFVEARLEKCIDIRNPRLNGTKVDVFLNKKVLLEDFYKKSGKCRNVIHADSMKLNHVCTNFDMHTTDPSMWARCKMLANKKEMRFNPCIWNVESLEGKGVLDTKWAVQGGAVLLQLFDKKDCTDFIEGDLLRVQWRTKRKKTVQ